MPDKSDTTAPYHVRRDNWGGAEAIERDGYTVLILAAGAQRNEEEVEGIVAALNRAKRLTKALEHVQSVLRDRPDVWPTWNGETGKIVRDALS